MLKKNNCTCKVMEYDKEENSAVMYIPTAYFFAAKQPLKMPFNSSQSFLGAQYFLKQNCDKK